MNLRHTPTIIVYPRTPHQFDPAVAGASEMGQRLGAELFVVAVADEWNTAEMTSLVNTLRASGLRANGEVRSGRPSRVILDAADMHEAILIVKAARPGDAAAFSLFGPTAVRLLRNGSHPVWIARANERTRPQRILVAVAPPESTHELDLEHQVITTAVTLNKAWDRSELHIVSAWNALGGRRFIRRVTTADVRLYLAQRRYEHLERLHRFLEAYELPEYKLHLRRGSAVNVIVKSASRIDADVVLVGAAARAEIRGALLGETVEEDFDARTDTPGRSTL